MYRILGSDLRMSVKKFGIFVSHNPHVDLRAEGLGRHLAMLIKGAIEGEGVKISIACPSWSRTNLRELLEEFDVPANSYEIIGPEKSSLFWTCVNFFSTFRKRVGRKKRKIHTGRRRLTKAIAAVRRLASKAVRILCAIAEPVGLCSWVHCWCDCISAYTYRRRHPVDTVALAKAH